MRYYYSFQSVLENLKIPYKQIQLVHLYTGYLWEELRKKGALYTKQDAPELDGELYKYKKEYQQKNRTRITMNRFFLLRKYFAHCATQGDCLCL